jgi:hypothetical protein
MREAFGRVAYTHKTHEKEADRIARRTAWLKRVELILVTLTAGSTISVLLGSGRLFQYVSTSLAALALFATLYQYRFNPEADLIAHRICARKLWVLRERYCVLLTDMADGSIGDADARVRRDGLLSDLAAVYEAAPDTDAKSYEAARKALRVSEELTFSNDELDSLLPVSLRRQRSPEGVLAQ